MDSKQLVSARMTFSYHNLIILMILLLNLKTLHLHIPGGKATVERIVWNSHEAPEMSEGGVLILVRARVLIRGCKCACGVVWHTPAAVTTATPPDTENKRKVIENYLHKTGECTISQTPQPEGAWLWPFIIAYWIIWINLTHLGPGVFPQLATFPSLR